MTESNTQSDSEPGLVEKFRNWFVSLYDSEPAKCHGCGEPGRLGIYRFEDGLAILCDDCIEHEEFLANGMYPPWEYWEQVRKEGDFDVE
jgi:hypothetical protein